MPPPQPIIDQRVVLGQKIVQRCRENHIHSRYGKTHPAVSAAWQIMLQTNYAISKSPGSADTPNC